MRNFIRFDIHKLLKLRSFYIFFFIALIVPCLLYTVSISYNTRSYEAYNGTIEQIDTKSQTSDNDENDLALSFSVDMNEEKMSLEEYTAFQEEFILDHRFDNTTINTLKSMVIASWIYFAIFISLDFSSGYLKNLLTIKKARTNWILSKVAVAVAFGIMALILSLILGLYTHIMSGHDTFNHVQWQYIVANYGLAQLGMIAAAMGTTIIMLLTQNRVATIIISILIPTDLLRSLVTLMDEYLSLSINKIMFTNLLYQVELDLTGPLTNLIIVGIVQIILFAAFNLYLSNKIDYQLGQ